MMTKTLALLAVLALSAGSLVAQAGDGTTAKFSVEKMTCAVCPVSVRKAMQRVDGVKDVQVDLKTRTATVIFDASVTTAAEVANASTAVGFPATELVQE